MRVERALAVLGAALAICSPAGAQDTLVVSPAGPLRTITAALHAARDGATILVRAGIYREPTIVVERRVSLVGEGWPTLDGDGERSIMVVRANGVTVRGLRFANVGTTFTEDRAALRLQDVRDCQVEDNRIDDAFFGIYVASSSNCRIARNTLRGSGTTELGSGNGIHLWSSRDIEIADNRVSGHRDGIYLEFAAHADVHGNLAAGNRRYGMHFMYSDSCVYTGNVFRENVAGVAVMYSEQLVMSGNRFERNWGSAAYGLLLKEIYDSRIERNVFARNSTGLLADGATRIVAIGNEFIENGWAVRLMASTQDGRFEQNSFVGNTFDVTTNSRHSFSGFRGNYWDDYRGYDLDRDGFGDVPHRPVRLFSLLVERNEPSLILLRSAFVGLLDAAERVLPALTPEKLVDARPLMAPPPARSTRQ
jgi:nitrous oxidase accessory protein